MALSASNTDKYPQAQAVVDASGDPVLVTVPVSVSRIVSAANSENATVVKASAGRVHLVHVTGAAGHAIYLKLYNKATTPSEADTPVFTLAIVDGVCTFDLGGHVFNTGIALRCVVNAADADDTALTANDFLGLNVQYT
jgi:hypothetical protein